MNFSTTLIQWYHQNKRILPWRNTTNPYHIWLSEIILQQTRVAQGLSYYEEFLRLFPTLKDLALADESLVMKTWQGLGYYSRARNLHATAKYVYHTLDGKFPSDYHQLIKLKGIGPYTAAAIASFAFKEPIAVVDGNVFRVLARYFGIYDDISLSKTKKNFQNLGNDLIDVTNPDIFNHAIMDFGATICTPQSPLCDKCPFSSSCFALQKNAVSQLPVKSSKTKIRKRFFHYALIENEDEVYIEKREEQDIWHSLYQFPLVETEEKDTREDIQKKLALQYATTTDQVWLYKDSVVHKLSHQHLYISFWKIKTAAALPYIRVKKSEIHDYAFPVVLWNQIVANF